MIKQKVKQVYFRSVLRLMLCLLCSWFNFVEHQLEGDLLEHQHHVCDLYTQTETLLIFAVPCVYPSAVIQPLIIASISAANWQMAYGYDARAPPDSP